MTEEEWKIWVAEFEEVLARILSTSEHEVTSANLAEEIAKIKARIESEEKGKIND